MRGRFAFITLLLLVSTASWSQETAASYKTQITELGRALSKNTDNVETLFKLAHFYFDNSHPMRNLPLAMQYARQAEQRHAYLLKNDRVSDLLKLQRNGITLNSIRQLSVAIEDAATAVVQGRPEMTLAEVDAYLDVFGYKADISKALRARKMELIYKQVLAEGSMDDCYQFVLKYSGTQMATSMEQHLAEAAEKKIVRLSTSAQVDAYVAPYSQSKMVVSLGEKYKSRLAYNEAVKEGTMAAYNNYLTQYPASDESEQARNQIDRLLEIDLSRRNTAMQLAHFADSNADLPLADRALAKMRKLIYRSHDEEAARYYVNNYKLDDHCNEVYGEYYSWYAVEGNAGPLYIFADKNPDFPFWKAMENDMEKGDFIDGIDLTKPYEDSAYADYSGYVRDFSGKPIAIVPLQRMLQKPYAMRNYAAAISVVKDVEPYFDNNYRGQYESLLQLLNTPTANISLKTEFADSNDIMRPVVNEADGMLYYNADGLICRASRKGNTWQLTDTVHFLNSDVRGLSIFSFFDGGRQMLVGYEGDIWIAEREAEGWRVSDIPPFPVNTDYVETDAYMLPDGSGMLFASDRSGGLNCQPSKMNFHGDTALATDLYYVPYTRNGWGEPQNLGLSVNSVYCEHSPIMSRNMKTLYYISDAHTGFGYGDVFMTERTDMNDWTSWTRPRNLGREVNSPWREASLSFMSGEKRVMLGSNFGGDHYQAYSFPALHNATSATHEYHVDVSDAAPTLVRIQVADMQQQAVVQVLEYVDGANEVDFRLSKSQRYALFADAGSNFVSAAILSSDRVGDYRLPAYTYNDLVSMDRQLPLPVVEFPRGKSTLNRIGQMQLEQLARFAALHPRSKLEVAVDVKGSNAEQCYNLSLQRAAAVRDWLAECGIPASRVILSAYGNARCKAGMEEGVGVRFRE